MGRSRIVINPETGKRLKEWLRESGKTQEKAAEICDCSVQHFSCIVNGKKTLTVGMALRIHDEIPNKNGEKIRIEYLLGLDNDYKTEEERIHGILSNARSEQELIEQIIVLHHYKIGSLLQEGSFDENGLPVKVPFISITTPSGTTRNLSQEEYSALVKSVSDYIEGQLLLKTRFPKDMAKEYAGGYFNG